MAKKRISYKRKKHNRKSDNVESIFLNPLQPLIKRIRTAFEAFVKPYNITVLLDEIQVLTNVSIFILQYEKTLDLCCVTQYNFIVF